MYKEDLSDIETERKIIKNIFGDIINPRRSTLRILSKNNT